MKLHKLLREAGFSGAEYESFEDVEITGISSDSRSLKKGEIFVALRGAHFDGAAFWTEAAARGAALLVGEQLPQGKGLCVLDAREALARLCDAFWGHPGRELSLIGITGTNGKTSTAFMLEWILRQAGERCGLIGTVCARVDGEALSVASEDPLANMTTPEPTALYPTLAKMRERGVKYVVMEVTSHALAFSRVAPLYFSRALFTNLSTDHLDLHGDMESYFLEKKKLFSKSEAALICTKGRFGKRLCEEIECPYLEISHETVRNIQSFGVKGSSFVLSPWPGEEMDLFIGVPGEFSVENAALAAACARSLGIPQKTVRDALCSFRGVPGRMECVGKCENGIVAFLDYAHTPEALEKLLRSVREMAGGRQRITLLFGCGGDRDRGKRRMMGSIASALADFVILTSDNARSEDPHAILSEILKGIDKEKPYTVIPDRREAILFAAEQARPGEILLLAGKGHENYEIRGDERLPFCEREILCEALKRRFGRGFHEN